MPHYISSTPGLGGRVSNGYVMSVCVCVCLGQTCSAGVSAQGGGPLQGGHRGRAADALLAVLHVGGARAGVRGVLEPQRGRGESGGAGGGGGGGRGRRGEGDLSTIFARLFLENVELRGGRKDRGAKTERLTPLLASAGLQLP